MESECSRNHTASIPVQEEIMNAEKQKELLSNFASGASSANVEIVFCFDTTGSMSACLAEVRTKLQEIVSRLLTDIPNIRIGIIAHGDYCDSFSSYVINKCDLCADVTKLLDFVQNTGSTGGGDSPECYELALRTAVCEISWTPGYSKALVMIGDEVPHPPSYTTEKINWFEELDKLAEMDVKVYGVRALNSVHSIPFMKKWLLEAGAISIHFSNFHLIVDMFLAICYRESSPEQLSQFQNEIQAEGRMDAELQSVFTTLAQPNQEKSSESKNRSNEPWFDLTQSQHWLPSFSYDASQGHWIPTGQGESIARTSRGYSRESITRSSRYGEFTDRGRYLKNLKITLQHLIDHKNHGGAGC